MNKKIQHPLILTAALVLAGFTWLNACNEDETKAGEVLVAADPPSVNKGAIVTVHLIADGNFFTKETEEKAVSKGGLTLRGIKRVDDTHAVAALETDEDTTIGLHNLEISIAGVKGTLEVSVLAPDRGPGEVSIENNIASSGAPFAQVTITGKDTQFDARCTVTVEGAPGVEVKFVDVESPTELQVHFAVSLDQEPVDATLVLMDGDFRYELPLTIVAHKEFENQVTGQVLTKGQVGKVVVYHKDATLYSTTSFAPLEDDTVEVGDAHVGEDHAAVIPVRVPRDYEGDTLDLIAETHSIDGAFLERVYVEVAIVEPAYAVMKEAKMDVVTGEHEKVFEVSGIRARDVVVISIEDGTEQITVTDWRAEEATLGSISLFFANEIEEGAHDLALETSDGRTLLAPFAVSDWETKHLHAPPQPAAQGDRVYLPVAVQAGDFDPDTLTAEGNEDITVEDVIYIDGWTAVLDLRVDENAFPSTKYITVHGETYDYGVSIDVIDSGV